MGRTSPIRKLPRRAGPRSLTIATVKPCGDVPLRTKLGLLAIATLVTILFEAPPANAFVLSTGQSIICKVQTPFGLIPVPEIVGFANGFAGFTQAGPNGLPFITFDPRFMPPPGRVADFLFYHECAHARFFSGFPSQAHAELAANCEGLRAMRGDGNLTANEEAFVGSFHATNNVYASYFGSGSNFWSLTLACASQPSQLVETVYGGQSPSVPVGSSCCTYAGPKVGPFPPPHLPVGAACMAQVGAFMSAGVVCN